MMEINEPGRAEDRRAARAANETGFDLRTRPDERRMTARSVATGEGAPRLLGLALAGAALVMALGAAVQPGDDAGRQAELRDLRSQLLAREGELALTRLQLERVSAIVNQSARHGIPADLAENIHDIAVQEGIDPGLAFSLVRVESRFSRHAVSPAGAVGLTQVMPSTATWLQPGLGYPDLFDPATNLRLGFRYLHQMLNQYGGDLRLALLAYNRGPGRVDEIRRAGGNPANGYARAVLKGR